MSILARAAAVRLDLERQSHAATTRSVLQAASRMVSLKLFCVELTIFRQRPFSFSFSILVMIPLSQTFLPSEFLQAFRLASPKSQTPRSTFSSSSDAVTGLACPRCEPHWRWTGRSFSFCAAMSSLSELASSIRLQLRALAESAFLHQSP